LPERQPGEIREYGFVVMPQKKEAQRQRNDASHMGIVQLEFIENDNVSPRSCPYFSGWCKTLEWNHNYTGKWVWKTYVQLRLNVNLKELPLCAGGPWGKVDDAKLATEDELSAIYKQARDRLYQEKACIDPAGVYTYNWELGLEESSLMNDEKKPHYLENLRVKSDQFKKAAADLEIDNLNLIWQVVEWRDGKTADQFLASPAAANFRTLAVHPYPWVNGKQDFIDPETWMPNLLAGVKAAMAAHHQVKPIWFTEVGAPVQYDFPTPEFGGSFETNKFGYPDHKGGYDKHGWPVYDNGISRQHISAYMAKVFAMALQGGVERLFWFNYKDNGADPYYAEHNFGLFDHDGFPKPSFATYSVIDSLLGSRPSNTVTDDSKVADRSSPPLYAYEFPGKSPTSAHVIVAWTSDGNPKEVPLTSLSPSLTPATVLQIKDLVGTSQQLPGGQTISIGGNPLFIETKPPPAPVQKQAPQILRPALPTATQ
jgi:hypothetical protein